MKLSFSAFSLKDCSLKHLPGVCTQPEYSMWAFCRIYTVLKPWAHLCQTRLQVIRSQILRAHLLHVPAWTTLWVLHCEAPHVNSHRSRTLQLFIERWKTSLLRWAPFINQTRVFLEITGVPSELLSCPLKEKLQATKGNLWTALQTRKSTRCGSTEGCEQEAPGPGSRSPAEAPRWGVPT